MKLRSLYTSPNYYSVCASDRTEGLVLHVVAGGVGMYSVVVELTPEEETEFRRMGHLDRLARSIARSIARDASKYGDRVLKPLYPGDPLEFVD